VYEFKTDEIEHV